MQSVNWCFTLNNYTKEEEQQLKTLKCQYICWGYEVGAEKGTPHLQGFIQFKTKQRLTAFKKINKNISAHLMKGTLDQAINYCKKEAEVFYERGELIRKGERTDLRAAKKKCAEVGMRGITGVEDLFNMQCIRSCEIMLTYHEEKRNWMPEVHWCYGVSGGGKSHYVEQETLKLDCYKKNKTKWWNGYDKHPVIWLDDFRACDMKLNELLNIMDRYEHTVEVKGSFRQLLCKKIYITTIKHPKDVYNVGEEPVEQILRRIYKIHHFPIKYVKCAEVGGNTSPNL